MKGQASPLDIYHALERLKKKGLLQIGSSPFTRKKTAFCELLGVDPAEAHRRLETIQLFVSGTNPDEKALVLRTLKRNGIRCCSKKTEADLALVLCKDYLSQDLAKINKAFLQSKTPWILAKLQGSKIWLGPFFNSPETGCWACLALRLQRNSFEESYVQNCKNGASLPPISCSGLRSTISLGSEWLATELFKIVAKKDNNHLKNKLLVFDLLSPSLTEHHLIKQPYCHACSSKCQKNPTLEPLILSSRPKIEWPEKGTRYKTPESTLEQYSRQIGPLLGVVECLENSSGNSDSLMHVYKSGCNFAISNQCKGSYNQGFRIATAGKGKTAAEAKVGALCEAIERYSGVFQGNEILKKASYKSLQSSAIDPRFCLQYSQRQYQEREATHGTMHVVPEPFDEKAVIEWTPVWSLTEQRYKYLPAGFCYYNYSYQGKCFSFCQADTNGNAAGTCLEEAILQGFFELVERDAVAIWWYNRVQRPEIDLASFNDPYLSRVVAEYRGIGREVWVLDLTSDLDIPTFAALSRNVCDENEAIILGFGSHFDPKIAIGRAITELNQSLLHCPPYKDKEVLVEGARLHVVRDWLQKATVANQPYLRGIHGVSKTANDFSQFATEDILQDVLACKGVVENKGMELLVLNQTRSDIGLTVVKVIVPGLRHFWPRFAPGRLYEVPVQLGWMERSLKEEELNPIPMFL